MIGQSGGRNDLNGGRSLISRALHTQVPRHDRAIKKERSILLLYFLWFI